MVLAEATSHPIRTRIFRSIWCEARSSSTSKIRNGPPPPRAPHASSSRTIRGDLARDRPGQDARASRPRPAGRDTEETSWAPRAGAPTGGSDETSISRGDSMISQVGPERIQSLELHRIQPERQRGLDVQGPIVDE